MPRLKWLSTFLVLWLIIAPALPEPAAAQDAGPHLTGPLADYSVQLLPPPVSAADAQATFDRRAQTVIDFLACGDEINFARYAAGDDDEVAKAPGPDWEKSAPRAHDEELTAMLLAKVYKYLQMAHGSEAGIFLDAGGVQIACSGPFRPPNARAELRTVKFLNEVCGPGAITAPAIGFAGNELPGHVDLTAACLRQQINWVVEDLSVHQRQVGSSGVPCIQNAADIVEDPSVLLDDPSKLFLTEGEYDVVLRNLVRLAYLVRSVPSARVLDRAASEHLVNDLLNQDGSPTVESYSVYDCGNTSSSTGSAEERADRYDFGRNAAAVLDPLAGPAAGIAEDAIDSLVDFLRDALDTGMSWAEAQLLALAFIKALVAASSLALGPGAAMLGAQLEAALATATAAAAAQTIVARIDESENHLLMINSSRYLINQIMAKELADLKRSVPEFDNRANGQREWLLERMQAFLKEDFVETNARAYQRFSVNAILNLRDYALDHEVKKAAEMTLDYLSAKFAAGSNEGRRVVPFRRRNEYACAICRSKAPFQFVEDLFYPFSGSDHEVYRFTLLAGLTRLLPGNRAHWSAPLEMIYSAVSGYRLPEAVLDLALHKSSPYYQRIKAGHQGSPEIYASAPAFLISAGGVKTPHASGSIGERFDPTGSGASMPTVLIPTAGGITRGDLIRFEGFAQADVGCTDAGCGNLCVAPGFACGVDPVVPAQVYPEIPNLSFTTTGCARVEAAGLPGATWTFINSRRCEVGAAGDNRPVFFAAVYRQPCPAGFSPATEGRVCGFLEAAEPVLLPTFVPPPFEAEVDAQFEEFVAGVKANNPDPARLMVRLPASLSGTYTSHDGAQTVAFSYARGKAFIPTQAIRPPLVSAVDRINGTSVEDWQTWPLASGDVLNADNGIVRFTSPRHGGGSFTLDFSDVNDPKTDPPKIVR